MPLDGEHVRDADSHRPGADDGDPGRPAPGPRPHHSDALSNASSSVGADLLRGADEQPALVERARQIAGRSFSVVADLAQARRRADVVQQALERGREIVAAVEQPRRRRAPLRHGVLDEPEHGRRGQRDCEPVRDERRAAVARRLPLVLEATRSGTRARGGRGRRRRRRRCRRSSPRAPSPCAPRRRCRRRPRCGGAGRRARSRARRAGRRTGWRPGTAAARPSGRRGRASYGRTVYASSAWSSASTPTDAVTPGGHDTVRTGSTIASVGRR